MEISYKSEVNVNLDGQRLTIPLNSSPKMKQGHYVQYLDGLIRFLVDTRSALHKPALTPSVSMLTVGRNENYDRNKFLTSFKDGMLKLAKLSNPELSDEDCPIYIFSVKEDSPERGVHDHHVIVYNKDIFPPTKFKTLVKLMSYGTAEYNRRCKRAINLANIRNEKIARANRQLYKFKKIKFKKIPYGIRANSMVNALHMSKKFDPITRTYGTAVQATTLKNNFDHSVEWLSYVSKVFTKEDLKTCYKTCDEYEFIKGN